MQELEKRLREDLIKIGLVEDFTLSLRPYSKTYFGRYDISSSTVIVYVNKTESGTPYSYEELLLTTIHEVIHCKQWHDKNHKRVRGVMHDTEFKRLYAMYADRAKARVLFKEVNSVYAILYTANFHPFYDVCCGAY